MRWWIVLCVAVLWDTASLQPTKEVNNVPERECCPCPKDSTVDSSNVQESITPIEDQSHAASVARAAEGCPCLLRSADSEGASSMFLPAAVRAIRPLMSLDNSKEDPKPLLHPEVDLASSVLDTLREATDQEYEDAVARDAARAAQEPDEIAAESAHNLVTVVLNPKDTSHDDVMPEASHVHEARCINPLGRSSLNLRAPAYDSPDLLREILRLPKRQPPTFRAWNLFDMDNGVEASNVNKHVVESSFKEPDVETPKIPLLRFTTENNKPQSPLTLQIPTLFKNSNNPKSSDGDFASLVLDKLRQSKNVPPKLEISDISKLIPKIGNSHLFRKPEGNDLNLATNTIDTDSRNSPSTFKFQIPRISTLIPKTQKDSSILGIPTGEDKLSKTNDNNNENSNSAKIQGLGIPNILWLNPKINSSIQQQNKNDDAYKTIPNLKSTIRNNQVASADTFDNDSKNSASSIQERYSNFAEVNSDKKNDLEDNTVDFKTPGVKFINLKNIENVDVKDNKSEMKIGSNLTVPDLKLSTSKSRDAATDILNNILKGLQLPNLRNIISPNAFNLRKNDLATKSTDQKEVVEINSDNPFATEILDTVSSPSEPQINHADVVEKEREDDINKVIDEEIQNMIEEMPVKTEILDSVPKSSETSDINEVEDPDVNEVETDNEEITNSSSEQTQKSLATDEETSELVNEIEDMNEDSIDDTIDDPNNEVMDRENHADNTSEDIDTVKSSDDIGQENFATENKIDGLAINSDIQSLSEKSAREPSSVKNHDTLQPLRERLRQKFENLKLAPKITMDFPRLSKNQKEDAKTNIPDLNSEALNANVNQVNLDDLQTMSDSLLNQEKEQKDAALKVKFKPEITNLEPSNQNDDVQIIEEVPETNNVKSVKKLDDSCIVNDNNSNKITQSESNEMIAGASERVASITGPDVNLASPLRQSIILEPSSFGYDLNPFNRPSLDLGNLLDNPLPTFKIPSLLKSRENNLQLFSSNDDSLEKSLLAQPSTSHFRSSLPPLQPLEDINLDILQLKPLSPDFPTLPRLNLNSFKTRLALPKSLDLKPVLLESSVGNEKGVVGATLTLGSGNELDRSNSLQQASSSLKSSNILRQSLGTLPSIDDFHETLWENAQNLLSTPLETTGRNAVEDTWRSSQVLTDNLRVQAENAVKDLHQNLASTFKGAGFQSHSGLGSFKSSSDLLEDITRRHEDVNDKLKGISVDLSDRLESLRDNILDQYRLPSLGSSILGQSKLLSFGEPKQSSSFRSFKKPSQTTLKFSNKGKFVTPATKRKSSSRASTNKSKLKSASSIAVPKSIEIPKLKAAPTESVGLKTLRKEPTLKTPHFLSRNRPTLNLLHPEQNLIDFDRPLIKKPRLGQTKVKISFSTTPIPPTLRSKSSFGTDSKLRAKSLKDTLSTLSRSGSKDKKGLGSKLSSYRDSNGFASEVIPSRVKAPLKKPSILRAAAVESGGNIFNSVSTTTVKPVISLSLSKPLSSLGLPGSGVDRPATILKSKSLVPDRTAPQTESFLRNSDISQTPALSWPKKIDDDFLTKVREAVRARLAEIGKKSIKPGTESKLGLEPADVDMARSASTNIEVSDPKIMKEDTSYTCKMMCTKNT